MPLERKTMAFAILAIVVTALLVLAATGHDQAHAEATSSAPPEAVWAILTDPNGYEEWNPILTRAEGTFAVGESMRYRMHIPPGEPSDVTSEVIGLEPMRRINQFGGIPGVLTFDHTWTLEPTDGGTRITQHEEYRGIGVWFWDPSEVERLYHVANDALGRRAESTSTR